MSVAKNLFSFYPRLLLPLVVFLYNKDTKI